MSAIGDAFGGSFLGFSCVKLGVSDILCGDYATGLEMRGTHALGGRAFEPVWFAAQRINCAGMLDEIVTGSRHHETRYVR